MKNFSLFLFLLLSISAISQNKANKIIVDSATKAPLEYVNIYNDTDSSISNSEGLFVFASNKKEINFSLIGYSTLNTTFEELKNKDSIFMEPKTILLDEVIISNAESVIKKAHDHLSQNYLLTPYSENFFMRCVLKKDTEITRLQDVFGKVHRETMFLSPKIKDNNYTVEILNMRKTGFSEKTDKVYFEFPNFQSLLRIMSSILLDREKLFDFTEIKSGDDSYRKINFRAKNKDKKGQTHSGNFIIKREDYAIIQFSLNAYDDNETNDYLEKNGRKFRTTKYDFSVNYTKNTTINKYYLSNSSFDVQVEVLGDGKIIKTANYDFTANYFVANSFINEKVRSNFSINKEIFKAKFPYSEGFWKNQNQLPLTNELRVFLNQISENKEKIEEFDIIGNF